MKSKFLFLIGLFLFCVGCELHESERILLTCDTHFNSEIFSLKEENITITFYGVEDKYPSSIYRLTTGILDDEVEDNSSIVDALKSNYCNSEIKEDYQCEAHTSDSTIIIEEKGYPHQILGIEKNVSIEEYQKMLEEKGFQCKRESK